MVGISCCFLCQEAGEDMINILLHCKTSRGYGRISLDGLIFLGQSQMSVEVLMFSWKSGVRIRRHKV